MAELSEEVYSKVKAACSYGDFLAQEGKYDQALAEYDAAWLLLPAPAEQWDAATWILVAKGDALFKAGDFPAARVTLERALTCPDGMGNPFIHLRLGEVQYELGAKQPAMDNLARAYMGAGRAVFADEPPKYLDALRQVMLPPPGHDSL
jgi:tetratricopeptide (TPR) repeat protein